MLNQHGDNGATFSNRADPSRSDVPVFARRVVVAVLITVVILAIAYFLWRGSRILLLAFAGVLFALFLCALSQWTQKHTRLSYRWSLVVVVAVLLILGGGLAYLLWSRISGEVGQLIQTLPRSFEQIRDYLMQYAWGQYLVEKAPAAATGLAEAGKFTQLTGFASGVASFLEAVIVILIVGIFGAAEPDLYKTGFLHLVPPRQRSRADQAVTAIAFNLRHWLVGQVLLMVLIGLTTAAGLWLIGLPIALTLGLITGIMEMVPYIGAWLAAVPTALIALVLGPKYLVFTLSLYLFLHLLEGYILSPLIQRQAVHLPPALTLVSQALMGEMFGILGIFVAAPLTVATMVLLQILYVEDTLGDEVMTVPSEPGEGVKRTTATG